MLSEIPSWFSNSKQRRDKVRQLFEVLNAAANEEGKQPMTSSSFEKLFETRWLVRVKVMNNILYHWKELKAYYVTAELANLISRYRARHNKEMLNHPLITFI